MLEDVLSYIQEHMTDIQAKNQIFPRAVCLYCRYVTGEANAQKRYLLCREAFENSRKDQRFEYTVELLGYMRKDAICLGKEFEAVSYQVWKKILEAMYQEYGVEIPQAEWGIEIPQNLFLIPEILLSARVEQGASVSGRNQRRNLYAGDVFQNRNRKAKSESEKSGSIEVQVENTVGVLYGRGVD